MENLVFKSKVVKYNIPTSLTKFVNKKIKNICNL